MAKVQLTGLISSITGSMGETTFSPRPGIIQVRKKVKKIHNPQTPLQMKHRKIWSDSISCWKLMPLKNRVFWEQYAKEISITKKKNRMILQKKPGTRMTAMNAYCAINQTLVSSGLNRIEKIPPYALPYPPLPETDIQQFATFHEKIKFKVWLPYPYIPWENIEIPCVVQIGISTNSSITHIPFYPLPKLSTKPIPIEIEKVKFQERKGKTTKVVEAKLKELIHPIVKIQFRTIAQNGKFSLPSPIYTVEVF